MPEPVLAQISSFLLFLAGGMALGLAYDFLRLLRAAVRPKRLAAALMDFSYWLAAFALVFTLLVIGTWGVPRLYAWLALLLGGSYYLAVMSRWCRPVLRGCLRLLGSMLTLPSHPRGGFIRAELPKDPGGRRKKQAGPQG